jgi:hypothetical protein
MSFNVTAPSTVGASFNVTGRLEDGSSFAEGAFVVIVVGTPTLDSVISCAGYRSQDTIVRINELVRCDIVVKDAGGDTTAVATDFLTPTTTGGTSISPADFVQQDSPSTYHFNITAPNTVGATFTITPVLYTGETFTQINMTVVGTPTTASTVECVGDVSVAGNFVRPNETVTCTITVRDGSGTTTGVSSDFATASLENCTQTSPPSGVNASADYFSMVFTVQSPNNYGDTFSVTGRLADNSTFTEGPFDLATHFFPDLTGFNISFNNVDGDGNDLGVEVNLFFLARVNISSLDSTVLKFVSGNETVQLTEPTTSSTSGGLSEIHTIVISKNDTDAMKLAFSDVSAISIEIGSASGIFDGLVSTDEHRAISGTSAVETSTIEFDSTSPYMASLGFVEYSADQGYFVLEFNEPVNVSTLDPTQIKFADFLGDASYTLTGGTTSSQDGITVRIELSDADRVNLALNSGICVSRGTCWIVFTPNMIDDLYGNPVTEVLISDTGNTDRLPQTFVADTTGPQLLSFTTDMNAGTFALTFDEPVRSSTFDPCKMTIQAASNASDNSVVVTLCSGEDSSASGNNDVNILVTLSTDDLNAVKAALLAASINDTFISMLEGAVEDLTNPDANASPAINSTVAIQTQSYTADSTSPQLSEFSLNLLTLQLILTFDEPVDVTSLDGTGLTLQATVSGGQSQTLSGGTSSDSRALVVSIDLVDSDVATIKSSTTLAKGTSSTFLFGTKFIQDLAGNNVTDISGSSATQASSVVLDNIGP